MQSRVGQRRFIAGAVCPRCGLMDKIVVDTGTDQRECVACGFSEARPDGAGPAAPIDKEVVTRVSRASARLVETRAEPVRLVDAAPSPPPVDEAPASEEI